MVCYEENLHLVQTSMNEIVEAMREEMRYDDGGCGIAVSGSWLLLTGVKAQKLIPLLQ